MSVCGFGPFLDIHQPLALLAIPLFGAHPVVWLLRFRLDTGLDTILSLSLDCMTATSAKHCWIDALRLVFVR